MEQGLVREVRARRHAPVWRRDDDTEQAFTLKLTAAGLNAVAADSSDANEEATFQKQNGDVIELETSPDRIESSDAGPGEEAGEDKAALRVPRAGTKISTVIDMLGCDAGATIDELVTATGWLPHTTRAALTGLRKRGLEIGRRKATDQHASAYVIAERNGAAQG